MRWSTPGIRSVPNLSKSTMRSKGSVNQAIKIPSAKMITERLMILVKLRLLSPSVFFRS